VSPTNLVPGSSFPSLDVDECCGGSGVVVPPSPGIAVGSDHVIAVVNQSLEIYDKSGVSLVGPLTLSEFFAAQNPGSVSSPTVVYDESADRFILAVQDYGQNYHLERSLVAVSTTGDPTGSWWQYEFAAVFGDESPGWFRMGVGTDAIYGTWALTDSSHGRVMAFDKTAMYAGGSATALVRDFERPGGGWITPPVPLEVHGWAHGTWPDHRRHYIASTSFDSVFLWTWDGPFTGSDTFTYFSGVVLNPPLDLPLVAAPQLGFGALDPSFVRLLDFEYRDEYGWVTAMTNFYNQDCIVWAQIDLSIGDLGPQGKGVSCDEEAAFYLFPDLAVNRCGDVAIGYTQTHASMYPSVWYTGREREDPPETLQGGAELKAGELTYYAFDGSPFRWGDFTDMTIDPDGETYWYIGEYSKDTDATSATWGTWIGSFSYPAPGLVDGGFEENDPAVGPYVDDFGIWCHDSCSVVGPENGIVPLAGSRMLRFDATRPGGAGSTIGCDVHQFVKLCETPETMTAHVTARFNRVPGDAETDREFRIRIYACTGSPGSFDQTTPLEVAVGSVVTDADPLTWESASASMEIPAGADYISVGLTAREDVFNDEVPPEFDGHYCDGVELVISDMPVSAPDTPTASALRLERPFPNPFSERVTIRYRIRAGTSPAEVGLGVHDVTGRAVKAFDGAPTGAGVHTVVWDGRDAEGNRASAGVYFVCLRVAGRTETRRITLVR
jgi:hypothetical protein